MEIYHYPLLCWQLSNESICARLVGTDYEMIHNQLPKLITHFAEHLQREYIKEYYLPEPLLNARLKKVNVKIRPAYQEESGLFPVKDTLNITVAAVSGETTDNYSECYLPLLDQHFYFYKKEQLRTLIEYFARDYFNNMTPEALHRYLMLSEPWLEKVSVRIKSPKNRRVHKGKNRPATNILQQVADQFPRKTKASRIAPETAWERSALVAKLLDKLDTERSSVLLIGEHGIGKTAIILEAARQFLNLNKEKAPHYFWRTTPQRMTAGARYLGEWQETCETLMEELQLTGDILWINDLVHLLNVGGDGPEDSIAAFMLPNLRKGHFQIVSELTQQEFELVRQRLPGFAAHFHVLLIPELSKKQNFKILNLFTQYVQKQLNITLEEPALNLSYRLLDRYWRYEAFPGKLINFLTTCVNDAYVEKLTVIDKENVLTHFIQKTGLPSFLLRDEILLKNKYLHDYFAKRIIGQKAAVEQVCQVVMIFKSGLNDPNKPIATLLFAGPTGVGKTACARALADYFFGQGQVLNPLIRLDMSEFQHPVQIDRLLGASGDKKPGKLIREVRERPFSVVLLDEIEKAHPIFFDVLLNVMDEGILIDSNGRVTDFRNVILIMTSNLGARQSKGISFVKQPDKNEMSGAVRKFFRPEFFNRLDQILTFQALSADTVKKITRKELVALNEREGFQERGLKLRFSDKLVEYLAKTGFDPEYGARPLQRTIEKIVVAKLAEFLLQNLELKEVQLSVDWGREGLIIKS